jgi:hypothetical protein
MPRTDMYFKVVVDHDADEKPDKVGAEIVRQIEKIYVVRRAEMTNFVSQGKTADDE